MALLQGVVERRLLEVNLARFPKRLFAFLLLARQKLRHVGIMTLRHILVPTFLDLIFNHVVHVLGLGDAPRTIGARDCIAKVHDPRKVRVVGL